MSTGRTLAAHETFEQYQINATHEIVKKLTRLAERHRRNPVEIGNIKTHTIRVIKDLQRHGNHREAVLFRRQLNELLSVCQNHICSATFIQKLPNICPQRCASRRVCRAKHGKPFVHKIDHWCPRCEGDKSLLDDYEVYHGLICRTCREGDKAGRDMSKKLDGISTSARASEDKPDRLSASDIEEMELRFDRRDGNDRIEHLEARVLAVANSLDALAAIEARLDSLEALRHERLDHMHPRIDDRLDAIEKHHIEPPTRFGHGQSP